jgi:hypothetical protein
MYINNVRKPQAERKIPKKCSKIPYEPKWDETIGKDLPELKRNMIHTLQTNYLNVSFASKTLGLGRCQHYNWMREDPAYRNCYQELEQEMINAVESVVYSEAAKGMNSTFAIFFLKCKGGWKEHNEFSGNVNITFNDTKDIKL